MESGHLFIVEGDITRLACDSWLLPTDWAFNVSESFGPAVGLPMGGRLLDRDWGDHPFQPLSQRGDGSEPWIWLGDIGRDRSAPPSFFAERAGGYVELVASHLQGPPIAGRDRRLVAVNLLGSGEGGSASRRLALCDELVPALRSAADRSATDVALVCWDAKAYSAAQRARHNLLKSGEPIWTIADTWALGLTNDHLPDSILELAAAARDRHLVLFIGAGVSVNAGVPDWRRLIKLVAADAGLSDAELERLKEIDLRDQAALLERRLGGAEKLAESVTRHASASRYSLTHALLASLRVREAVTTNYDQLYEDAVGDRGEGLTVIPGEEQVRAARPWLLKLHGGLRQGGDIVMTREDYSEVAVRRGALLGLLQAMLLTRKMLFVGYSLADEDFHSVISAVRKITGGRWKVGTALTLFEDPLFGELWSDDLDVIPMLSARQPGDPSEVASAARRLQIFLDLVGSQAADLSGFLLAPGYEGLLSDDERRLRDSLIALKHGLQGADQSPGKDRVGEFLRRFGSVD